MTSTNKLLLEAKGITKYFGTITALENVNLKVHEGECLGVVGDNGAGKYTDESFIWFVQTKCRCFIF